MYIFLPDNLNEVPPTQLKEHSVSKVAHTRERKLKLEQQTFQVIVAVT